MRNRGIVHPAKRHFLIRNVVPVLSLVKFDFKNKQFLSTPVLFNGDFPASFVNDSYRIFRFCLCVNDLVDKRYELCHQEGVETFLRGKENPLGI